MVIQSAIVSPFVYACVEDVDGYDVSMAGISCEDRRMALGQIIPACDRCLITI